jgi:hypothetical protein
MMTIFGGVTSRPRCPRHHAQYKGSFNLRIKGYFQIRNISYIKQMYAFSVPIEAYSSIFGVGEARSNCGK